jgi:hypothetical protein
VDERKEKLLERRLVRELGTKCGHQFVNFIGGRRAEGVDLRYFLLGDLALAYPATTKDVSRQSVLHRRIGKRVAN